MRILAQKEIRWLHSSPKRRNFRVAESITHGLTATSSAISSRHSARTRHHAVPTLCGPARSNSLTSPRRER